MQGFLSNLQVVLLIAAQLIAVTAYIVWTHVQVRSLDERVRENYEKHRHHFEHEADRTIHQQSMDTKLIEARFDQLGQRMDTITERLEEMHDLITRLSDRLNGLMQ